MMGTGWARNGHCAQKENVPISRKARLCWWERVPQTNVYSSIILLILKYYFLSYPVKLPQLVLSIWKNKKNLRVMPYRYGEGPGGGEV